jgi:TPR repeat protein
MYRDGLGIEMNKDKAKELLMKAIELDGTDNMPYYELGNLYYEESKYEDALKYYKEAKSNSFDEIQDGKYVWLNEYSTKACYKLGLMYDAGQGVEKNAGKAFEYMKEAASRGSDEAKEYLQERNLPIPSQKLGSNAND